MKKVFTLLSLTIAFVLSLQTVSAQLFDETKEREAVKLNIMGYEEGWNRHDAKAIAELYHTDAAWVNWFGEYEKGRDSIQVHFQKIHSTYYKTSHVNTVSIEDLTFIKSDVAVSHVRMDLTGDERYPGQTMRFRRTIIMTKRDGVWRILAGQNAKLREDVN